MDQLHPAIRQPNGDLLIPAQTAELLERVLHRLQQDLKDLHGQKIAEPGQMETSTETANRQDFVDQLAASAGIEPATVAARLMQDSHYVADSTEPLELLQCLSWVLFGRT